MARRGRPRTENVHRTATGEISHQQGARPNETDATTQPHRRPFLRLVGDGGAGDWRCGFALGRLRMIGECEERMPSHEVRRLLFSGHDGSKGPFGISERLFFAGMKCAETIGRERIVRATPKDKPQAIAFGAARGIDLSVRELTPAEAALYVARYEDMNAALLACWCPPDARRALRVARGLAAKLQGPKVGDLVRILRGLGALMNPAMAGTIKRAVEGVVLDDRDPGINELYDVRAGLKVLADHFFGPERDDSRAIVGVTFERPTWPHDERVIEVLYPDGHGGVRPARSEPQHRETAREEAHWKRRHRSHAGG